MRELSIADIERVAKSFKEDMQREATRYARRHDSQGALAALECMAYVDDFVDALRLEAGSHLREYVSRPARARPISLSQINRK